MPETTLQIAGVTPLGVSASGSILLERHDRENTYRDPESRMHLAVERTELRMRLNPDGSPRSVTRVCAEKVVGLSRTGKSFCRWRTTSISSVIATKSGKQIAFRRERGRNGSRINSGAYFGDTDEWSPWALKGDLAVRAAEILGPPPSREALYPLAKPVGLDIGYGVPSRFLACWLGAEDPQTLTRNLFGITRYRRDLVKAVAGADPLGIWLAWQMRGFVPVDYLVTLLRNRDRDKLAALLAHPVRLAKPQQPVNNRVATLSSVREHLRTLDRTSLRRLVDDAGSHDVHRLVEDLVRQRVAPPGRVRSWRELHDRAAIFTRNNYDAQQAEELAERMKEHQELLAKVDAERAALEGVTGAGLRVVAAREPRLLVEWGVAMNNCIAGYASEMVTGACHLLGIYDRGDLIANVELQTERHWQQRRETPEGEKPESRRVLHQLLGPANRLLPEARRADVISHLAAVGVEIPDDYWGAPRTARQIEAMIEEVEDDD